MADPNAQLQSLVDRLGNNGTGYLDRIDCMNGEMAKKKDTNAPGYFATAPDVTVGQACRGLLELSADATARGRTGSADLTAPYRELVDLGGTNPTPQRNQAAQRLVNVFVNAAGDSDAAVSPVVSRSMDGKNYRIQSGAAMDASFTNAVLQVKSIGVPPRLYPQATEAQINEAVEACVRGRASVGACRDVGQDLAARYFASRPRSALR